MSVMTKILAAAAALAETKDYKILTRQDIAAAAGVSESAVTWYFRNMAYFRSALIDYAYTNNIVCVLGRAALDNAPELDGKPKDVIDAAKKALIEDGGENG